MIKGRYITLLAIADAIFCNHMTDIVKHVLLFCRAFSVHRQVMMNEMERLISHAVLPYLKYEDSSKLAIQLTHILVKGTVENDIITFKS